MGVEIEAQDHTEVQQVRSRELQMENTEKLEEIIPIVQNIDEVNLQEIESNTNDIKNMVETNLEQQVDLNDISDMLQNISKSITELKKANTRLSNTVKDLAKQMDEIYAKYGEVDG